MTIITYTKCTMGETTINTIEWKIPTFQFQPILDNKAKIHTTHAQTKEYRTRTSTGPTEDVLETQFKLKLRFLGIDNDIIEIYCLPSNQIFIIFLKLICIRDHEEQITERKANQMIQDNKWHYLGTFNKENQNSNYSSTKSYFSLKLEFVVTNSIASSSAVAESQLGNNLEFLLNNGLFSDVTMRSSEKWEYKVHKGVLASRSAVLKAHFEHNTTECTTNIVETPFESEVLGEVLTFIYSDRAPKIDMIPEKLLAAADYYQLNRLKNLCEEALIKKLTIENAIDTLQLADLHMATYLRDMTLEFIKDGRAKLITETDSWANVRSIDLIKTIYQYAVADYYDITFSEPEQTNLQVNH